MTAIPYWHVDAFSAGPFGGNQAAVMLLDTWLTDDELLSIAAENAFAATAFAMRDSGGGADWELRWFTPAGEIALCGHATLATGHVLLAREGVQSLTFSTRQSGILEVRSVRDGVALAVPAIPVSPSANEDSITHLGSPPLSCHSSALRHNVFVYADEAAVRALTPDLRALARLGNDQFICTAPGDNTDIVSRVFVPGAGVGEDAVTGSAHAALAPFWAERLGKSQLTAHQASARGGNLTCRLEGDKVWLGGACTTIVEGAFLLD